MHVKRVEIDQAQAMLPDLVALIDQGTEVILTERGRPRAKLTAVSSAPDAGEADDVRDAPLPEDAFDDVGS